MFVCDVEVRNSLIQSFGLEHHLDFQNSIIAAGKTDQKKKKLSPGIIYEKLSREQHSISL